MNILRLSLRQGLALAIAFTSLAQGPGPVGAEPERPASTVPAGFVDTSVAFALSPTALAFTPMPDAKMYVTRQEGIVEVFELDGTHVTQAINIDPEVCGDAERGLMGMALDPAFASNRYIYLFANFGPCDANNVGRVVRYTVENDWAFDPNSRVTIVDRIPSPGIYHSGGHLEFGKDGKLYISTGDGFTGGDPAQDKSGLSGKMLRVNPDGTPPADNPFYNEAGSQRCGDADGDTGAGTCQEIYAYGLRNPFGFAMDPNAAGTRFFINDVGQSTWEEIDENVPGANYGWPLREGPCAISVPCTPNLPTGNGFTDPIHWLGRDDASSVTGGAFVPNNSGWPGEFTGAYLFGEYSYGKIYRLNRTSQTGTDQYTHSDFVTGLGLNSAVGLRFGPIPNGGVALYYTTYFDGGEIRRVIYTEGAAPIAVLTANPTSGPQPLTVNFNASGTIGGAPLSYNWAFGDGATQNGGATAQHTYSTRGVYTATVTVQNQWGSSNARSIIQVGTPPSVSLNQPAPNATFTVSQTVTLAGGATDSDGNTLPPSALSWIVLLHHVEDNNPTNDHTHPLRNQTGVTTTTFTAPAPEDLGAARQSYLEIRLTATDSFGLSTTVSRLMQPQRVTLTFNTSPAGFVVDVFDKIGPTPIANDSVVGWTGWTLTAVPRNAQLLNGDWYAFKKWVDGPTDAARTIQVGASDATYTAEFVPAYGIILPYIGHP